VQNPVDEDANVDLLRRARHFASFTAHRSIANWRVGGEWLVSGPSADIGGVRLGGYGVMNLSARYDITKSWYINAQIDNVFDKHYETAYRYNTPGLGAYLTIGWQQL
jgi:vitamin B12 transporter